MDHQLITNGSFSNRTLEPWTTDIEGKVHYAPYEKGSFSILLPVDSYLEQRIEKPLPVSSFLLSWEFTARVDPKAPTDESWFFIIVSSRAANEFYLETKLIELDKSWKTIKHNSKKQWPAKNEGLYIQLINAKGVDSGGNPFNEPVEITDINMHRL